MQSTKGNFFQFERPRPTDVTWFCHTAAKLDNPSFLHIVPLVHLRSKMEGRKLIEYAAQNDFSPSPR